MSRPKKAVNVAIPIELLEAARASDINLSATLEAALQHELRQRRRSEWVSANAEAIGAYNLEVQKSGVFSDTLRGF